MNYTQSVSKQILVLKYLDFNLIFFLIFVKIFFNDIQYIVCIHNTNTCNIWTIRRQAHGFNTTTYTYISLPIYLILIYIHTEPLITLILKHGTFQNIGSSRNIKPMVTTLDARILARFLIFSDYYFIISHFMEPGPIASRFPVSYIVYSIYQ